MAQEDAVSKAKSELNKANKLTESVEGKQPSMYAKPAPSPNVSKPAAAPKMPSGEGSDTHFPLPGGGGIDTGIKWRQDQQHELDKSQPPAAKGMPIMHDGGIVQKDGPAMLQKGETVVPAKKSPMMKDEGHKKEMKAKSGKKHNGFKKTTIHHHTDGTHTVEHEHENPKSHVSGTHADLNGVHDSLEANIGQGSQPDMPQAQPQMADAGAPAAAPAAAAAPAPAAAAPVMA